MIPTAVDGLIWLLVCLLPFLLIQRVLHREMQALFLILTRSPALAVGLFSFLFFPGVLLHESSHFLMAKLLRVPTGRFSLTPQLLPNGVLRLGYLETKQVDPLREALVGVAPLITGGLVVALLGAFRLGLMPLAAAVSLGDWSAAWRIFLLLPEQADFWIWFYLALSVSSTMLPSASDRQSWLPVILVLAVLTGVAIAAGAGPWMLTNLAPRLNNALRAVALVFAISLAPHLVVAIPVTLLRLLLSRITGLEPT
ncbi:hypothetical protein EG834_10680 [bacterium]|nr:hypothetical protein [bacterium]